jgi:hypothetical protein
VPQDRGEAEPRSWRDVGQLVREHLALLVTGVVLLTVGLRVLAATRGDASGALALLQNADPVEVVLGMGIQLLPLVPLAGAALVIAFHPSAALGGADGPRVAVAFVLNAIGWALAALALLVPNRVSAYVGIGVGAALVLLSRSMDRRASTRHEAPSGRWGSVLRGSRQAALIFTGAVYLILALSPTMWLPREIISHRNGARRVGFVLRADADRTVILTSDSRRVRHLATSSIRRREICVLRDIDRPLLFEVLGGDRAHYEPCERS